MCRMSLVTFMNSGCLSASPELFQQSKSLSIISFAPGLIGHCCLKRARRITMHTLPISYALHKWKKQPCRAMPIIFLLVPSLHFLLFDQGENNWLCKHQTHIRVLYFLPITVYFPKILVSLIPITHCLPTSLLSF